MIDRLINVQAYVLSADDIFYASAVIFLLLIPLLWFTHPLKSSVAGRRRRALTARRDGPNILPANPTTP